MYLYYILIIVAPAIFKQKCYCFLFLLFFLALVSNYIWDACKKKFFFFFAFTSPGEIIAPQPSAYPVIMQFFLCLPLLSFLPLGYEKYNSMRADPTLCFLERVGMPDAKAIAAEQRGADIMADGVEG